MGKVEELQLVQQNLQHILSQKQQLETQITELDSAITELGSTSQAYKIVGKIMIATSSTTLISDLKEQKENAEVRLKSFVSQEAQLKTSMESLQKEAVEEMKDE
jgi:prefoldin beta subunit